MVDHYVHEIPEERFTERHDDLSKEFLIAVTTEFIKDRDEAEFPIVTSDRPTCHYHQHDASCPECEDES